MTAEAGSPPQGIASAATEPALIRFFGHIGRRTLEILFVFGEFAIMLGNIGLALPKLPRTVHLTAVQMMSLGVQSLPLVLVTAAFTGAVTAVQAAYQFQGWVPLIYLGTVTCRSVVIELGPVLTALVVGGRVGASTAAELGTMKVTEQIDAMEVLAVDPVRYLVMPRVLALFIMLPILTIFADIVAIVGAGITAHLSIGLSLETYKSGLHLFFKVEDALGGLTKAAAFGLVISLMGCFFGMRTEGGAEGVGRATTQAVVASCLLILILDYFLAAVLFQLIFK